MERKTVSPKKLRHLQRQLCWVITDPNGVRAIQSQKRFISLTSQVVDTPPLTLIERFDIYAEAYFARLLTSLEEDFKILHRIVRSHLGESAFRVLVAEYLKKYPSHSPNITEVGRHLPCFTKNHRFRKAVPYLSDIASLEWQVMESFYAKTTQSRGFKPTQPISEAAWLKKKVVLDPSIKITLSKWPLHLLLEDKTLNKLRMRKTTLCTFRVNYNVKTQALSSSELKAMKVLKRETTLGYLLKKVARDPIQANWVNQLIYNRLLRVR